MKTEPHEERERERERERESAMAGLLAWAADVVGGSGQSDEGEDDERRSVPALFTPEQQSRARELDDRAKSLRRSIQDLRLRIPPAHIAQRLPHLHAHSVASSNALALQLNAHSTTREQAQLREVTLLEENAAYEKAISNCQKKIDDKVHEAELLCSKLKELDMMEKILKDELEKALAENSQFGRSSDNIRSMQEPHLERQPSKSSKVKQLEDKKHELSLMEENLQSLENQWASVQHESARQPSPAQREKLLEKQLHGLVEQLTAKQAQAEGLMREIRNKEKDLEILNGLRRRVESETIDTNTTRNRFNRGSFGTFTDSSFELLRRPLHTGSRTENQQKLMLLRSALVLYILTLNVIVFIKLSF
ncbi:Potassium channel voltage dependent Kv1.4 tandem inactivation domain-containing protein [Dioscorea alata]|uniref:Potassium channel voltage dependent Kv1.4 tandem inactivation domain-containing protein n=1 Tax=Dioscorea alata TaxID=55571 RepID=A0ACB7VEJ8_DIOAL|nr:Potassium channel voltage dependent Kv1.4 tandem inactivation domain-containing protein [Dioscorea alata]